MFRRRRFLGKWLGIHCLITDDDDADLKKCLELLEDIGMRAGIYDRGMTAVSLAAQAMDSMDPFELMIIDWKMPDMDGWRSRGAFERQLGDEVPIIILTAYDWSR